MSVFIIAELSANHGNNIDIALDSVRAVAKSGADSIKLQTYTESCLTLPYKNEYFRIKHGLWRDKYLWDLYKEAQMPWEWHKDIFDLAAELGIIAFSSPFSVKGVEFLENLDCPIYKIASFEISHVLMLEAIARTKKEVIISLGIANQQEIDFALNILKDNKKITLLYCISDYPAKFEDVYLSNIANLKQRYQAHNIEIGISDHTLGITLPIAATLCGASAIEKHFILHKDIDSPDREFSLDSNELCQMVKHVREAELLQGLRLEPTFHIDQIDTKTKPGREFTRSLFICKNVKKGEQLTLDNIACVRPNSGLSPLLLHKILGCHFNADYEGGTPLNVTCISDIKGDI